MATAMSPSKDKTITKGQAGKFADLFADRLAKSGLPSGATQLELEENGSAIADEFVANIRERVERREGRLIRTVTVNRTRPPQEAVGATGRNFYGDKAVVATMPSYVDRETELVFLKVGRYLKNNAEAVKILEAEGLKPDPVAQCAWNEAHPEFATEHPNFTVWDGDSWAAFYHWYDDRNMHVARDDHAWNDYWWLVGARKSTST